MFSVDPSMPPRLPFVFLVFFVAAFALQCLNRRTNLFALGEFAVMMAAEERKVTSCNSYRYYYYYRGSRDRSP